MLMWLMPKHRMQPEQCSHGYLAIVPESRVVSISKDDADVLWTAQAILHLPYRFW